MRRHAIFVINLLQDVNIVRPLVFMAARDLGLRTTFLVSHLFLERDKSSSWRAELIEIGEATATPTVTFDSAMQALQVLQGKAGVLVAGSESDLSAHTPVHDVFRLAPPSFVKITLQHGFECIGFLHNRAHDVAHGRQVAFAADVVCGWCESSRLTSMAPSQRSKLYVSGPPAVLQMRRAASQRPRTDVGLVCENLHSVRLNATGDFKPAFIETFNAFCAALAGGGRNVALRPHPGGQYFLKKGVALPPNALLNNHPMYKVDLSRYAYGISAPSSALIDMVLAGIPTAVWRDGSGTIDARNYQGLTEISSLDDWVAFSRQAVREPELFIKRQQQFLDKQQMPLDPEDVYARFAGLLRGAANAAPVRAEAPGTERVLLVANDYVTTLQVSFVRPLKSLVDTGEVETDLLTEQQMKDEFKGQVREAVAQAWIDRRFAKFKPTIVVFCRYSGPHADHIVQLARREAVPVISHIDDDLLNVPEHVGLKKHKSHNDPLRLATVRHLLDNADLVYCSTEPLKRRFAALGAQAPLEAGKIYCSGSVLNRPAKRPVERIGCMGIDKGPDLDTVLPAIVAYLRRHTGVAFELFGSMAKPVALEEFGDRVTVAPSVRSYEEFLKAFAARNWDIGICPLMPAQFNMFKANTKWVDYTSAGVAVIASGNMVYDECCADGCGILVSTTEEWLTALERLTADPAERFAQVTRAQKKLAEEYSIDRLRDQVLNIFAQARAHAGKTKETAVGPAQQDYRIAS